MANVTSTLSSDLAAMRQRCNALNVEAWKTPRSQPARAQALAEDAAALARQIDYGPGLAAALRVLSRLRSHAGQYDQALLQGLEALDLAERCQATELLPSILNQVANAYRYLGDTSEALGYFRRQEQASQVVNDRLEEAKALIGIGAIYSDTRDYANALTHCERSLAILQQLDQPPYWTGVALNNLCFALFKLNRVEQAIQRGQQALTLARSTQDQRGALRVLNSLSEIYLAGGDIDQALTHLEQAQAVIAGLDAGWREPDLENETLRLRGQAYLKLNRDAEALACWQQALAHSDQYKLRGSQYECHQRLAEVYKRLGDYRQALAHHELYESYKEAVFSEESAAKLQNLEVLYRTQAAQKEAEHFAHMYEQTRLFNEQLESEVRARTEDLRRAYDQLARLDQAKSNFITVTAHELRTPLTVLKGYVQILRNDPGLSADAYKSELLSGILAGSARMHEIINTMLLMVKIDSRTLEIYPQPIELRVLMEKIAEGLKSALDQRRQTLRLDPSLGKLSPVEADLDAVEIVFQKIIENAIKYTPDGGRIEISGRAWQAAPPPDLSSRDCPAPAVEIIVSDSGIGIDPASLDLIFTKFYHTEDVQRHSSSKTSFKGGGPGLGLAIARGIVEAHHGRLWAESAARDEACCPGSRFHVVLPQKQH